MLRSLFHEEDAIETLLPQAASSTQLGAAQIDMGDALERYEHWPAPVVIVSDGAYGVSGFPGDPSTPDSLAAWYAPHIAAWSRHALPSTTLWFWGVEIGWATVHPLLALHGWEYRALHIWDKGLAHVAGNVNSKTIRRFPVATEVCAQYVRQVRLPTPEGESLPMQQWLRHEWLRTGLPLCKTNEACGVKNAATRKYFTHDHLWYYPPPEMMVQLAHYANKHGRVTEWPYFSVDGKASVTAEQWSRLRAKWNHAHGITNVWQEPAVRGTERVKDENAKCLHGNQKPLNLIERIVCASSDASDVVWEPFGGLCTVAVACLLSGRQSYSAEINPDYYRLARTRLLEEGEINAGLTIR